MFEVTKDRCLVYRPEHHIDNPKGLVDATGIDPDFRIAFDPVEEGRIDHSIGLKRHIRSPGLPPKLVTAAQFIVAELDAAVTIGRTSEGFRRLGAALHTVEDYYAHSNFVELSLIELGHTNVFPWAGQKIVSPDPDLNGKFPVVTGMFGGTDTLVSVLDILGEHFQNVKPCDAGKRSAGAKIAIILLKDKGQSEFAERLEFILTKIEDIKRDFPELATLGCRLAEAILRWLKALVGALIVRSMDLIAIAQKEFENDPTSIDPTHSMLAKDHDVHPLHIMAANLAQHASQDVADAMNRNWLSNPPVENPVNVALQYLVHPAKLKAQAGGFGPPLRKGQRALWKKMEDAAGDAQNAGRIKKVEGRGWMQEQLERAKKEQEEIRKRAKEIDRRKTEQEIQELIERLKKLQPTKPFPNA